MNYELPEPSKTLILHYTPEQVQAAIHAAVLKEREACAQECNAIAHRPSNVILGVAIECLNAIRARSEE